MQGLGTGASKKTEVEDVLTDASIDDWLKEQGISNLPAMLAKAKKGNINPRWQGPVWSPKNKRYNFRSVAERNATIEQLEKGIIALPPLWPFTIKEGQIGSLTNDIREASGMRLDTNDMKFRVMQIVDKETAMIRVTQTVRGMRSAGIPSSIREIRFFLVSAAVENLHEDQTLESIAGTYRVEGNKQYTALSGTSTIPVLKSYDLNAHLDKLKK